MSAPVPLARSRFLSSPFAADGRRFECHSKAAATRARRTRACGWIARDWAQARLRKRRNARGWIDDQRNRGLLFCRIRRLGPASVRHLACCCRITRVGMNSGQSNARPLSPRLVRRRHKAGSKAKDRAAPARLARRSAHIRRRSPQQSVAALRGWPKPRAALPRQARLRRHLAPARLLGRPSPGHDAQGSHPRFRVAADRARAIDSKAAFACGQALGLGARSSGMRSCWVSRLDGLVWQNDLGRRFDRGQPSAQVTQEPLTHARPFHAAALALMTLGPTPRG